MSQTTIQSYFETKLNTWAAAQSPAIQIAYEGIAFTKPEDAPYLELYLLPAYTMNPELSGRKKREAGIFQVSVVVPDGQGMGEAREIADAIVALFPVVPKESVSIEQTPHVAKPFINSDGRRTLPISITYRLES